MVYQLKIQNLSRVVPNVPCGVERYMASPIGSSMLAEFLMYRVELKVIFVPNKQLGWALVPNVPCGVERGKPVHSVELVKQFLMYRVELKEARRSDSFSLTTLFLMYRVELKALTAGKQSFRVFLFLMYRVELKAV